jgi:XRE family transcriptional regulator, regulator of sulfur utilization
MITKRDVLSGWIGVMLAAGVFAAAEGSAAIKPILGPTVFRLHDIKVTRTATGEVQALVKQPTATVDELEMHVTTLNPGMMSHPPHRHVNEELIIIDRGECETLSDGKWIKAGPGDVVFNASNSLHGFRNVGQQPATYHVINWSPNKNQPHR